MTWAYETEADETVLELVRQACRCAGTGQVTNSLQFAAKKFLAAHPTPFGQPVDVKAGPVDRSKLPRIAELVAALDRTDAAIAAIARDTVEPVAHLTVSSGHHVNEDEEGAVQLDVELAREVLGIIRHEQRVELARLGVKT